MEPKIIQMAALGRALYPGMLYDCRSDSFIPGVTLWDKQALSNGLDVHDQTKTYVNLAASDSVSEKANLLDVSASLKASFLGGLVEVGGSAKYLTDTTSSTRQCRVTMQYSQTTKFEQLTMKELGNITYPQVFEQKTATHVVTAVLYGASAFMVFDYTSAENENKQVVEGSLYAAVKKIPTISIEGQASLQMSESEKNLAENMNVTFYGDYELEENPTTYTEALRACKRLPSLLKERGSKGVPVTVWLYPLTLLDRRAAKLVREISMSLVSKTENLLEELSEVQRRCNDLIKNPITLDFPDIKDKLLWFKDLVCDYKISFQKALVSVLPGIRSGELENKALGGILTKHYSSPFTDNSLNKWLDNIRTELNILNSYTSGLKDITVVTSAGLLNSILFDPDVDVVVCLSFTSLNNEDSYLAGLQDFVDSEGQNTSSVQVTQPWFASFDISEKMRKNLSLFTRFSDISKNEKRMKFLIVSIHDPSNPGTSIRLYQNGLLKNAAFQPVSKPSPPTVDTSAGQVTLKLSKSPTGETIQFRVEYRMTPPTDSADDDEAWTITKTSDAQPRFIVTGLKAADKYWVRYRAVGVVGMSEASNSVPFTFQGKIDFTVDPWDLSMPSLWNNLRTKLMTSKGMSRWSASTIESEVTDIVENPKRHYGGPVSRRLKPGMAVYTQGVVLPNAKSFEIALTQVTKEGYNTVFHMYCHIAEKYVAYNTCKNNTWHSVERIPGCPLSERSSFDVFLVITSEGYEVQLNGQRHHFFKHRMPVENVSNFGSYGDIQLTIFGIVPNWNTSTFATELNISGVSRTKYSDIQSDVPHPVCNPQTMYSGKIPVALRPGVALFFQGVFPSDGDNISINLQTGVESGYDIALHISLRLPSTIVLNTCNNGVWQKEEYIQSNPFVKGGAFDIFIITKPEGYEVVVNGLEIYTFEHRIPVEKVNSIRLGLVFINKLAVIEAYDVNIKAINPASV
ncbi:verrucotoxin subunit beta-like [Neoarius graeffei]|uniref:verrucotoxin subunit beta-like n=1 Tax=Neoarius graeffei TaxID=443677 RepID=UPI00298C26B0|nr:verrucotoxin subunit beta-like [Neoarius graeffei]